MSKHNKSIPILGSSRCAQYTHADFSKDLQVYHLTNKHHPNQLYDGISKRFVQSIQLQNDPSNNYSQKMKNIYMDQLDNSLNQYKNKMMRINTQAEEFKRDYKQNVNSLVLYIQKDGNRRNEALKNCLKRQQERQNRFIDADMLKNKRIDQYIKNNEFGSTLLMAKSQFNQDQQQKKRNFSQKFDNPLISQVQKSQQEEDNPRFFTNREKQNSYSFQINLPQKQKQVQYNQQVGRRRHKHQNSQRIECNQGYIPQLKQPRHRILRVHNPITNPIEYHIDNPYFINKMQRKFQKS